MKLKELLTSTEQQLKASGVNTARLDSLILIEDFLGKDRSWILANPEHKILRLSTKFVRNVDRRQKHEPLAYIRGKTEFFNRTFVVNKHVLVPRPESETMIDLLKKTLIKSNLQKPHLLRVRPLTDERNAIIVDVGTGSGALAITTKLEMPEAQVLALDIDPECIKVAKRNAKSHKVDIELIESDLLTELPTLNCKLLTILANLPYVPEDHPINDAAKHEPRLAIFGGKDGLDLYRQLFEQLSKFTVNSQQITVLTESLPFQHQELAKIARRANFKQTNEIDLIQIFVSES